MRVELSEAEQRRRLRVWARDSPRRARSAELLRKTLMKPDLVVVFTCDECWSQKDCEWTFDPYNTNGDCLAEK